jgi:hypothetical protein|tara:strand:+ start:25 stop:402 length:378 start_codon:yes stop_codon:yes gene_type:complete
MAHFAEISDDGTVLRVIVVNNAVITDDEGVEQEQLGKDFCQNLLGGGTWVQTSYNNNFRQRFAYIGGTYDSGNNVFLYPKPFPSWTLNSDYEWEAPVPYPNDGNAYNWSEEDQEWVLNDNPAAEI